RSREGRTLEATKIRSVEGGSDPRGNEDQIGRGRVGPSRQRRSDRSREGRTLEATKIRSVEGGSDPRGNEDQIGRGRVGPSKDRRSSVCPNLHRPSGRIADTEALTERGERLAAGHRERYDEWTVCGGLRMRAKRGPERRSRSERSGPGGGRR